ncbi:Hypothetical_protein [Hexamita inflata]|uniref:Hypothetical_protein n=1 Tax=Hexamita inflata TaxID=28002 RepID=A0AA86U853_9EUKA|nr:Hypothetical protein HINF_LOCUS30346 [Hexamita inflata]
MKVNRVQTSSAFQNRISGKAKNLLLEEVHCCQFPINIHLLEFTITIFKAIKFRQVIFDNINIVLTLQNERCRSKLSSHKSRLDRVLKLEIVIQLWEVELLFLVYYVSNYILKYFATSNADDKFQQIISSWRLFMNYSLTQEGQKYDFDRIRPQSTIQSRYLIFQKGKIEITTCNKRTAMTKINAVEDVQGRSTNSLNKLRQF